MPKTKEAAQEQPGTRATQSLDQPSAGEDAVREPAGRAPTRLFNQSLAKAFAVLEAFGVDRRAMNLPELAAITGLSKSAVQRLTYTLETLGYLRKDARTKRYSLTPRTLGLGMRYVTSSGIVEAAAPYLLSLNIKCGETVNLSEPHGTDMIFTVSHQGRQQISVQLPVGGCYPIYCTAAGRALLSGLPIPAAKLIIERSEIYRYTPATITDRAEILRMVDEARHAGFAFALGEFYRGDINIAAPVFGADGQAVAAVGVSVPVTRWTFEDACARIAPEVTHVAQTISSLFSSRRPVGKVEMAR